MAPKIEKLNVEPAILGEGPHWDVETQSLYFVDYMKQTINKYVPSTGKHTKAHLDNTVSIIIPVKGKADWFVITSGREIALISWDGESDKITSLEKLYEVDENTDNAFNDGKCDPSGRLWTGTMGSLGDDKRIANEKGSLFSFKNGKITKHVTKIGVSNGLAFDTTNKKFYYNDSLKGTLDQFDFDIDNGTICNRKPIYTLFDTYDLNENNLIVLDGMAIDLDGNLWVAVFNKGKVIKVDPRKPGTITETVQFSTKQVTSVAFGGPNLDELYVTTATFFGKDEDKSPSDGALYRVTGLNTKGLPGERVVL